VFDLGCRASPSRGRPPTLVSGDTVHLETRDWRITNTTYGVFKITSTKIQMALLLLYEEEPVEGRLIAFSQFERTMARVAYDRTVYSHFFGMETNFLGPRRAWNYRPLDRVNNSVKLTPSFFADLAYFVTLYPDMTAQSSIESAKARFYGNFPGLAPRL